MEFLKCSENKRQLACIKNDIRKQLTQAISDDQQSSFDMERTVNRITYIKMKDTFSDFITALS